MLLFETSRRSQQDVLNEVNTAKSVIRDLPFSAKLPTVSIVHVHPAWFFELEICLVIESDLSFFRELSSWGRAVQIFNWSGR